MFDKPVLFCYTDINKLANKQKSQAANILIDLAGKKEAMIKDGKVKRKGGEKRCTRILENL